MIISSTDDFKREVLRVCRLKGEVDNLVCWALQLIHDSTRIKGKCLIEADALPQTEIEETLLEVQNKVRRRSRGALKIRSPRNSPNILRRAKKRRIPQIQNSLGRTRTANEGSSKGHKRANKSKTVAKNFQSSRNPPIQLIPAISKKKPNFWVSPPQVP